LIENRPHSHHLKSLTQKIKKELSKGLYLKMDEVDSWKAIRAPDVSGEEGKSDLQ